MAIPGTLAYSDLLTLYEENKGKIYMTEKDGMGQHLLSEEGFRNWTGHLRAMHNISGDGSEIETYMKFAEAIHNKTRYVTFPEYMGIIELIAGEIIELIKANDAVFFVVSGQASKSNTWVMLLFFGELLKLGLEAYSEKINIIHIEPGLDDVPEEEVEEMAKEAKAYKILTDFAATNKDKTIAAIHFDDMSYTGEQLGEAIYYVSEDIKKRGLSNLSYHIAVAFITTVARKSLSEKSVLFFKNTEIVPTIKRVINEYYKAEPDIIKRISLICNNQAGFHMKAKSDSKAIALKRGLNAFGCYFALGQSAIYFDHKIADDLSVLSTLFSKGSYPPNIGINEVTKYYSKKAMIKPTLFSGPLISSCNGVNECYTTFYKRFKYTFRGSVINPSNKIIAEIELIKSQTGGSWRKTMRPRFYGRKSLKRK